MGDSQQVSRTESGDDLELPAPEETNSTETVIEIITPEEEEEEEEVEAKEGLDDEEGAATEPKKSINNKGDAADSSRSKTGAKALANRVKNHSAVEGIFAWIFCYHYIKSETNN